jgi:hypothetical protein
MPQPIRSDSINFDLTKRFQQTTAITGSPALAAETIIATLTLASFTDIAIVSGVLLQGWAAYTVGTSGTAVTFKIRQTNTSGSTIVSSGALTGSQHGAGILSADDINGFDSGAGAGVYVLTMQVTAGAAASTVSAVQLSAIII